MIRVQNRRKRLALIIIDVILSIVLFPINLFRGTKETNIEDRQSFLIVRADHIGDVLLSTPIYRSIKNKYPNSKITVLCGSWASNVLLNNPFIDKVIEINCPWWSAIRKDSQKGSSFIRDYLIYLKTCSRDKFNIFIDLRGDLRQILLFGWIPFIPLRISYSRSGGKYLLTNYYEYDSNMHQIENNYKLISLFEPMDKKYKIEMFPKKDEIVKVNKYIESELKEGKYITFFNGGRSALRKLSVSQCNELIESLQMNVLKIVIVGGSEDNPFAELLLNAYNGDNIINTCGQFSINELHVLISRAVLHIGNDSSISHVAASTDTPTIIFYGPVNPKQAMPLGENKKVIYHHYPCSPCLQNICKLTKSKNCARCIEDIRVDEILAAVKQIFV